MVVDQEKRREVRARLFLANMREPDQWFWVLYIRETDWELSEGDGAYYEDRLEAVAAAVRAAKRLGIIIDLYNHHEVTKEELLAALKKA